jgi:hypothetical protein
MAVAPTYVELCPRILWLNKSVGQISMDFKVCYNTIDKIRRQFIQAESRYL